MAEFAAAVPAYLGEDYAAAPPGHHYSLYGAFWRPSDWTRVKNIDVATHLKPYRGKMDKAVIELRDQLLARQRHCALQAGGDVLTLFAQTVGPFVTGTGMEHPLENGMAFLNPYGLPYLPGSGIKGVLRQAATELDWRPDRIDELFGPQTQDDEENARRSRGALTFWDAIARCDHLDVDIMTPHQGDYYQGKAPPTDCRAPLPIPFLVVPPRTPMAFHVTCQPPGSAGSDTTWKPRLTELFHYAFDWLGFGAKTAIGYGQMRVDGSAAAELEAERARLARERELAAQPPLRRDIAELETANPNDPAIALLQALQSGRWDDPDDQRTVAVRVRDLLNETGRWNPTFSGSNKAKTKQKARCLEVLKYLGEN